MKTCASLLALLALAAPLAAQTVVDRDPGPSPETAALEEGDEGWIFGGSVGVSYDSKEVTYGLIDNKQGIVTPSAKLSFGHEDWFTVAVGVEALFDTTRWGRKEDGGAYNDRRWKYKEFDPGITLSRNWKTAHLIGSSLDTSINYTYEYHPDACKKPWAGFENANRQLVNFEFSAPDWWLVPTLAIEWQVSRQGEAGDEDGKGGVYASFDLSHEFDLGAGLGLDEETLLLTPTVGIGMGNRARNRADFGTTLGDDGFMLRDGYARIALDWQPVKGLKIGPYAACWQQLDSNGRKAAEDDDFAACFGAALTYEF